MISQTFILNTFWSFIFYSESCSATWQSRTFQYNFVSLHQIWQLGCDIVKRGTYWWSKVVILSLCKWRGIIEWISLCVLWCDSEINNFYDIIVYLWNCYDQDCLYIIVVNIYLVHSNFITISVCYICTHAWLGVLDTILMARMAFWRSLVWSVHCHVLQQ